MRLKTGFNLVVMLACLAFGPKENRDFLFRTPPDQLYGETEVFRDSTGIWSVARNASSDSVELLDVATARVWSASLEDGSSYASKTEKKIYAGSLAIIERGVNAAPAAPYIRIGDEHPRTPRGLHIATEAETFYEFLWPGIVALLAVTLTYMINDLSWECGSPIRDIIESKE